METISSRLEVFLNEENLKKIEFAERIGSSQQTISNVMGGRNKPSVNFIQNVALNFPRLNVRWLLIGEGSVFYDNYKQKVKEIEIKLAAAEGMCEILKNHLEDKDFIISSLKEKISKIQKSES